MPITVESSSVSPLLLSRTCLTKSEATRVFLSGNKFLTTSITISRKTSCTSCRFVQSKSSPNVGRPVEKDKKGNKIKGKVEHHLWKRRNSAQSGQKALTLVRTICELPNEKESVYGALDKWTAWETEFPLVAAAKALNILRKRGQWVRVIQLAKWMLSKGQGATMGTYDTLLLAFDMDQRIDEAESLWNMIIHAHMRSVSKRLFSRMISLYDHHNLSEKIVEIPCSWLENLQPNNLDWLIKDLMAKFQLRILNLIYKNEIESVKLDLMVWIAWLRQIHKPLIIAWDLDPLTTLHLNMIYVQHMTARKILFATLTLSLTVLFDKINVSLIL
ncbi:uncharacterized protein [Cicer arietinum]|uniref:Pentatricopeptide repeat-containing protein At4g18975, chloroplastic isoform X2 n=1 Tax=Cicer arietinum TaxID=3827 RepID=A0A1S2Y5Q3_CICAR|nr:pentatricopeptide repeat-containing protein At4g18975, chloroplastic isoform X2 [Cicer arietinum]